MVDRHAALGDHFLQIPQAQPVGQVPAYAQHDQRALEMATLEQQSLPRKPKLRQPSHITPKFATEPPSSVRPSAGVEVRSLDSCPSGPGNRKFAPERQGRVGNYVPVRPCRQGWALRHDDGDRVQFRSAFGELPVEGQEFSALGGSRKVKGVGEIHSMFHPVEG